MQRNQLRRVLVPINPTLNISFRAHQGILTECAESEWEVILFRRYLWARRRYRPVAPDERILHFHSNKAAVHRGPGSK